MNMNRLIGMILRPIINRGVNAGIDAVARKRGPSDAEGDTDTDTTENREARPAVSPGCSAAGHWTGAPVRARPAP